MDIQESSFSDPQQNLERDDELLALADKGEADEALRFWESPRVFVVLGRACVEDEDVDVRACQRDRIPVLRRSSGGGTVLQGPGCLNFSLILSRMKRPELGTIHSSYRSILEQVLQSLKVVGVEGELRPVCDLVLKGTEQKFSGNAQRRGRKYILHHGTILYDFDLGLVARYLRMPLKMPEYRRGRAHADFMTNVLLRPEGLRRSMAQTFASAVPVDSLIPVTEGEAFRPASPRTSALL